MNEELYGFVFCNTEPSPEKAITFPDDVINHDYKAFDERWDNAFFVKNPKQPVYANAYRISEEQSAAYFSNIPRDGFECIRRRSDIECNGGIPEYGSVLLENNLAIMMAHTLRFKESAIKWMLEQENRNE